MDSLVFDTSAILNFGHRGDLGRLLRRFSGIHNLLTTPGTVAELTDPERKAYYDAFLREHFTIQAATIQFDIVTLARLTQTIDSGEITVMTLAKELRGTAVLDETAARREEL